ncbi:MAG: LytTR family transcriptional regulator [Chitinophagaceae bacterium]|nr:LytTR family transcriptional regulator [Chitinophagaceae bacterium]
MKSNEFMFIKSEFKIIKANYEDILFLEGLKDYTKIYIKGKPKPVLTLQSLKYYEAKLESEMFIRVHKSFIISVRHIDVISKNIVNIGEYAIPVSESYRKVILQLVQENS